MKVIHLSDTHIGRDNNALRVERLIADIVSLGDPDDHVVVHTGDLNDSHALETMDEGRNMLKRLTRHGWRVLLAPGNHDYGDSLHVDPHSAQRFKATYGDYLFGRQLPKFPVLTLTDDCAFIGLDTNQAEMRWWDRWFAEGYLGAPQIAALDALLERPEVVQRRIVVYFHHHPFLDAFAVRADIGDRAYLSHALGWNTRRFRRLKDAYSLLQCLRDRAHILLFGHQHYGLDYSAEARRYGVAMALDASSSTCTRMDTTRMRYRIIDTRTLQFTTRLVPLP